VVCKTRWFRQRAVLVGFELERGNELDMDHHARCGREGVHALLVPSLLLGTCNRECLKCWPASGQRMPCHWCSLGNDRCTLLLCKCARTVGGPPHAMAGLSSLCYEKAAAPADVQSSLGR